MESEASVLVIVRWIDGFDPGRTYGLHACVLITDDQDLVGWYANDTPYVRTGGGGFYF